MLPPSCRFSLSVISASFPPESRGKAIGIWVDIAGGGAVLGLFTKALLLDIRVFIAED